MSRILRPAIALLTFMIGVALSSLCLIDQRPVLKPAKIVEPAITPSSERQPVSFSAGMHACGPKANYHTYEASDGVLLSQSNESFSSAKRANQELQKKLHLATEIIERTPELDESGRGAGEKVVAIIAGNAYVFRTNGRWLSSTGSSSLNHVLEFEKR